MEQPDNENQSPEQQSPEHQSPGQENPGPGETTGKAYPLATRMQRLAAALLDDFIALLTLLPVMGYYDLFSYIDQGKAIPMQMIININIYAFAMFLIIHGFLLYNYGQTIGKRVMGIAISTMDFNVPDFNRLIALRYVPFRVAGLIPGLNVLPIINVLFIFREDRRCLHDLLAGTQVIYIGEPRADQPE